MVRKLNRCFFRYFLLSAIWSKDSDLILIIYSILILNQNRANLYYLKEFDCRCFSCKILLFLCYFLDIELFYLFLFLLDVYNIHELIIEYFYSLHEIGLIRLNLNNLILNRGYHH